MKNYIIQSYNINKEKKKRKKKTSTNKKIIRQIKEYNGKKSLQNQRRGRENPERIR